MAEPAPHVNPPSDQASHTNDLRLRKSTLVWVGATLVLTCVATSYLEFKSRSAHMAMSNLPLAVLLPFVGWLLLSLCLKRLIPRLSLTTPELRAMLGALWVGASFAGYNWATQWVGSMAAPYIIGVRYLFSGKSYSWSSLSRNLEGATGVRTTRP